MPAVTTAPAEPAAALDRGRSHGMDGIRAFLEAVRDHALAAGRFRGVLHAAIGRRISAPDGTVLSVGVTWRELANLLKDLRFDKNLVTEFGIDDPDTLSPRDRERFWYAAIAAARVDSADARASADALAPLVLPLGFVLAVSATPAAPPVAEKSKKKKK